VAECRRSCLLKAAELLPSAPRSLEPTVSASAGIKLAQPFRIYRYMPSISLNYFIARSASHQTGGSFESRMYLFADHQFSFAASASTAAHQLHHPQRNYAICFDRQQHQWIDHRRPLYCYQDERAEMVPASRLIKSVPNLLLWFSARDGHRTVLKSSSPNWPGNKRKIIAATAIRNPRSMLAAGTQEVRPRFVSGRS
jgi:hypothetical protein